MKNKVINNKTLFTKRNLKKLFSIGLIAAISTTAGIEITNSCNTNKTVVSSSSNNLKSITNSEAKINSMINAFVLSNQPVSNFIVANTNANNVINKFIANSKIDANSMNFKYGFSTQINKMMNNPQYLKQLLHSSNLTSSQYTQINSLLNNLKNQYGSNSLSKSNLAYEQKPSNINFVKDLDSTISNFFSFKYQAKVILNNAYNDLSNLAYKLNQERSGLAAAAGALAAVLGVLGFFDAGTTGIIAAVIGTVMEIVASSMAGVLNVLAWSMSGLEGDIDNNSSLLGFSNTLSQVEGAISQCSNALEHCIQRLSAYKWVIGVNSTIDQLTTSMINLSNENYQISKSINLLTQIATNQNNNLNITSYIENAVLNWITSNKNALNSQNSSFTDLIQQSMHGYKILNNAQDFSNFKVSFTKLSSQDGALSNKYWLTITATATRTINFTNWNNSGWYWNSNTVKSVNAGSVFTWVLPYSISDVSLVNNKLSLQVDSTYTNWYYGNNANYNLAVPFGLSIGNSSNLTAISSTFANNIGGVIASNYGSYIDNYTLPSTWTFLFGTQNYVANTFDAQIQNNVSNFGNTNENTSAFLNNLINEWMVGFKLNANASDFTNWHVSWDPTMINGYKFLQLSAYSTTNIQPQYWDQALYGGYGGGVNMNYTIPANSYFTWTLPYYWNSINSTSNKISLSQIASNDYYNWYTGYSLWKTPLGLEIGSSIKNPNSISSNSWFTNKYLNYSPSDTSENGVIGIGYGEYNTTPNLSFSTTWNNNTNNQQQVIATVNENLYANVNINNILVDEGISTLSSYINQYQTANFKQLLLNDFLNSNNLTVTNLSYSLTNINSVTIRNNSGENINVIFDGNLITTLLPHQIKTAYVNISLINWTTFANTNQNLNLTVLWHEGNTGAVDYFNQMWCYNGRAVYDMAAIYGFLSTNITSQSAYNNFDFNDYGDGYTTLVTSQSWTTYYNPKYCTQTIQLAWMADILGIDPNGFEGYGVYVQNASNIVISQVEYDGIWYAVNYNINLGGRFCLNWYFW